MLLSSTSTTRVHKSWPGNMLCRVSFHCAFCSCFSRYTTFNHVFKTRWSDVLAFRQRSMFTQCEICQLLKADLQNKQLSLEAKLSAIQMYRQHLHDQFADRTLCWRMQATSQDHESRLLTICIDGLDQAKFALPRDPQLRSSAVMRLSLDHVHMYVKFLFLRCLVRLEEQGDTATTKSSWGVGFRMVRADIRLRRPRAPQQLLHHPSDCRND